MTFVCFVAFVVHLLLLCAAQNFRLQLDGHRSTTIFFSV